MRARPQPQILYRKFPKKSSNLTTTFTTYGSFSSPVAQLTSSLTQKQHNLNYAASWFWTWVGHGTTLQYSYLIKFTCYRNPEILFKLKIKVNNWTRNTSCWSKPYERSHWHYNLQNMQMKITRLLCLKQLNNLK